jgi:hypothetical protein
MRVARNALGALSLFVVGSVASSVAAEERACVVVTSFEQDRELARELGAELEDAGFVAIRLERSSNGPERVPAELLREHSCSALAALESSHTVELWLARTAGQPLEHETLTDDSSDEETRTLALRFVELVRARLLKLPRDAKPETTPAQSEANPREVEPRPKPVVKPRVARDSFGVSVGGRMLINPGGFGPTAGLAFGALGFPSELSWLKAEFVLPVSHAEFEGPEGTSQGRIHLVSLALGLALEIPDSRLAGRFGVGAALGALSFEGAATPPFVSHNDSSKVAVPFLDAELNARLVAGFRVGIDAQVGMAVPRAAVRFAGREVASWGRPMLNLGAGLEFDL